MSKQPSYRSTSGFTLIEMIVVLVIASVLALIAAPGWLGFMNNRRAEAGKEQVLQFLRQAQVQAIRTRRNQVVGFKTADGELPVVEISGVPQRLDAQVSGNVNPKTIGLQIINGGSSCPSGVAGCVPFDDRGNIDRDDIGDGIKLVVTSPAGNQGSKRCVIVQTLLGAMSSGKGDECQ